MWHKLKSDYISVKTKAADAIIFDIIQKMMRGAAPG